MNSHQLLIKQKTVMEGDYLLIKSDGGDLCSETFWVEKVEVGCENNGRHTL